MEELERVVADNVVRRVLQMSAVRQTHVRGSEGENGAQFVALSGKRLDVVVLDVVVRGRVAEGVLRRRWREMEGVLDAGRK